MTYFKQQAIVALRLFLSPLSGIYWAITGRDWLIDPDGRERKLSRIFGESDRP